MLGSQVLKIKLKMAHKAYVCKQNFLGGWQFFQKIAFYCIFMWQFFSKNPLFGWKKIFHAIFICKFQGFTSFWCYFLEFLSTRHYPSGYRVLKVGFRVRSGIITQSGSGRVPKKSGLPVRFSGFGYPSALLINVSRSTFTKIR